MSVVVWTGIKFFANLVRCKVRGIAKIAVRGIAKVVRARFYHGAKFRLLLIFAPVVILLGSAFPKPCWWATAANFLAPFGNSAICGVVGSKRKLEKVLRPTLNNRSPRWVRWSGTTKLLLYLAEMHQRKFVVFRNRKKQGAKTTEIMALSRGTKFWWLLKPKKNGVKWKNIFQTGCKMGFFVAVSRGPFLYLAKAEQQSIYAFVKKSVNEKLLFFKNRKKHPVKTAEKRRYIEGLILNGLLKPQKNYDKWNLF